MFGSEFLLGLLAGLLAGAAIATFSFSRVVRVGRDRALVVQTAGGPKVMFDRAVVWPTQKVEEVDLSVSTLSLEYEGPRGLQCKDYIRADVRATFYVRVYPGEDEILTVARSVGAGAAGTPATISRLFDSLFRSTLEEVARTLDFFELLDQREAFRNRVHEQVLKTLNGYVVEDLRLERLEQTPINRLDPSNACDAQAIAKLKKIIEERTASPAT